MKSLEIRSHDGSIIETHHGVVVEPKSYGRSDRVVNSRASSLEARKGGELVASLAMDATTDFSQRPIDKPGFEFTSDGFNATGYQDTAHQQPVMWRVTSLS